MRTHKRHSHTLNDYSHTLTHTHSSHTQCLYVQQRELTLTHTLTHIHTHSHSLTISTTHSESLSDTLLHTLVCTVVTHTHSQSLTLASCTLTLTLDLVHFTTHRRHLYNSSHSHIKENDCHTTLDKTQIHQAKSSHHRLNQKHKMKQAADPRAALVNPGRDTLLSQHAPGMGFTFCPFDTNM